MKAMIGLIFRIISTLEDAIQLKAKRLSNNGIIVYITAMISTNKLNLNSVGIGQE